MIVIEQPLRSVQEQREALKRALLYTHLSEGEKERLRGAIVVLDWLEHGHESPVEALL